jgi:hypothetical protein
MFCIIIFCIIKISIKQMKHITKYLRFGSKIGWDFFLTIKKYIVIKQGKKFNLPPNSMVIWIAPYLFYFTRRNIVYSNHIFVMTMWLMSKPTNFRTSSVLVLCVHVVVTTRRVEPNSRCRCDYNLWLIWFSLKM